MHTRFNIKGASYRLATQDEIDRNRDLPGAPHVMFGCIECGLAYWTAKNIALSQSGGYNGARNIFYCGGAPECTCNPVALRHIVGE